MGERERKFAKSKFTNISAKQARDAVSEAIRGNQLNSNCPKLTEPLDYENFVVRNRTILENDGHRDLVLFPRDDIAYSVVPKVTRTAVPSVTEDLVKSSESLLVQKCLDTYLADYHVLDFNYHKYSEDFRSIARGTQIDELPELSYECDMDEGIESQIDSAMICSSGEKILLEGNVYQGRSEGHQDSLISFKGLKKRFCCLRQGADGSFRLDFYRDKSGRGGLRASLYLESTMEVIKSQKKGKPQIELHTGSSSPTASQSSIDLQKQNRLAAVILALETDEDCHSWLNSVAGCLEILRLVAKKAKLEETVSAGSGQSIDVNSAKDEATDGSRITPADVLKLSTETDQSAALLRQKCRFNLFALYPDVQACLTGDQSEDQSIPQLIDNSDRNLVKFLVECRSLSIKLPVANESESPGETLAQVEPFFLTMTLFDALEGKRLSEVFSFDLNPAELKSEFVSDLQDQNSSEKGKTVVDQVESIIKSTGVDESWLLMPSRKAIFSVSRPHADVFLVVRVEKILLGGIAAGQEAYGKPDTKTTGKLQKSLRQSCAKLGRYRMPFAWTARPIFQQLIGNEAEPVGDILPLFKSEGQKISDEELVKLIGELKKSDKSGKISILPNCSISLKLDLTIKTDVLPDCMVDTSYLPLRPFDWPPASSPVFEIENFSCETGSEATPHNSYRNHLYVYPVSLKFDSQRHFNKARNLVCSVELRNDDSADSTALNLIYGQRGLHNRLFVDHVNTAVSHHDNLPQFYQEVKIRLPVNLSERHHLLFRFSHISVESALSDRKKSRDGVESHVGFAWLPLLTRHRLNISESTATLSVAVNLPNGYLASEPLGMGRGFSNSEVKWIEGGKPLFRVNFKLKSTVLTKDLHLANFFSFCQRMSEAKTPADIGSEEKIKKSSANDSGDKTNPGATDNFTDTTELVRLIKTLHAVDTISLINFLPTILNQLLSLLPVSGDNEDVQLNTIRTLVHIVNEVESAKKHSVLDSYVKFVFVPPSSEVRSIHEELLKALTVLLRPGKVDQLITGKFLRHSRFFTRIITKSMAIRLLTSGRIKMSRTERFSADFQFRVETFFHTAVAYICQKYTELREEVRLANQSLAEFLKTCLSLMNRGFILQLIHFYIDKFDSLHSKPLVEMKLEFIGIVANHEHLVPLSLPLFCSKTDRRKWPTDKASSLIAPNSSGEVEMVDSTPPTSTTESSGIWRRIRNFGGFLFSEGQQQGRLVDRRELESDEVELRLSEDFCRFHYPTGVILQLLSWSLTEPSDLRHRAILLLRNLLVKHAFDPRLEGKRQSRLASLYFPLISVALMHLDLLKPSGSNSAPPSCKIAVTPAKESSKRSTLPSALADTNRMSSPQISLSGTKTLPNANSLSAVAIHSHLDGKINDSSLSFTGLETDSNLNAKVAFKRAEKSTSLSHIDSSSTPVTFLLPPSLTEAEVKDLLVSILYILKSVGDDILVSWWKASSDQTIERFFTLLEICLNTFTYKGRRKLLRDYLHSASRNDKQLSSDSPLPSYKGSAGRSSLGKAYPTRLDSDYPVDPELRLHAGLEANLSNEVGLIILDILALFCQRSAEQLGISLRERPVLDRIVDLYLALMTPNRSETLLLAVFASLRSFVKTYSRVIFGTGQYCASLCQQLLKCCNSALETVETGGCAVLYLLMKENFYASGQRNFTKVHLQIIISLSQLLGDVVCLNSPQFHRSLGILSGFVTADRSLTHTAFEQEVKEVVRKLRTVLSATALLSEHADDPEMLADLQVSLANSYAGSPELRRTWLESLARLHIRHGNIAEAAECQMHIAALIAEVLRRKGLFRHGCDLFEPICPDIAKDEGNVRDEGGLREVQYSDEIFVERVEQTADLLVQCQRYEQLGFIYRLVTPIYEEKRNFQALSRVYKRLFDSYVEVMELNRNGKRRLGSYFKVSFYGQAVFEDQHGLEYIYKEPNVTSLAEISSRLLTLYSNKFGLDTIKLISHSNPVNVESLDPKCGYVQVVHVTPHFEASEAHRRITEFDRHSDLCQFVFETPFTTGCNANQAPTVDQQWKRKTFITTARSFPYLVKRIPVESKRHVELDPLEVAMEEMSLKTKELLEVTNAETADLIKLQLRLQGCVLTTVNAGPLSYAETFTDAPQIERFGQERLAGLKEVFKQFLLVCSDALGLNAVLISSDQTEYHRSLVDNFRVVTDRLNSIFNENMLPDSDCSSSQRRSSAQVFNVISSGTTGSTD